MLILNFYSFTSAVVSVRESDSYKKEKYSSSKIIDCLRAMNFMESIGNRYIPTYTLS